LPAPGESQATQYSGRYCLFDLVPALLERIAPQTIEEMFITTLSYSKTNASQLIDLLDAGTIKRCGLIVSAYFKSTSREIYDALVPKLLARGMQVLAMRTHAK